jgi:hypothetical protein
MIGYLFAVLYAATILLYAVFSHQGNQQTANALRQVHAVPWVVPTNSDGIALLSSTDSNGVITLYSAATPSFDIILYVMAAFFAGFYLVLRWAMPELWLKIFPLAVGTALIGGIDALVIGSGGVNITKESLTLVHIDPLHHRLTYPTSPPLDLCAAGIRSYKTGNRGLDNWDVELLEHGAVTAAVTVNTQDAANSITAFLQSQAATAHCPIPAHPAWPADDD